MAILIDFDFVSRTNADTVNASGTVTFYDTGTTTLKTVYSDAALTTALENPYTLDSAGRFSGSVYSPDGERYAILESDSLGADIRTRDPVWGARESGSLTSPDGFSSAAVVAALETGADVYLPAGTYDLTGVTLTPSAGQTIYGQGAQTILTKNATEAANTEDYFSVTQDRVTIRGLRFSSSTGTAQHGITILGANMVKIRGCFFDGSDMNNVFVYKNSGDVVVEGCYFDGGKYGVATGGDSLDNKATGVIERITIQNNVFQNTETEAIDINWETKRVLIDGNQFYNCDTVDEDECIDIGGGEGANNCEEIIISNNVIDMQSLTTKGIRVKELADAGTAALSMKLIITGNIITRSSVAAASSGANGVHIVPVGECVVSGNIIENTERPVVIAEGAVNASSNIVVSANVIKHMSGDGISVSGTGQNGKVVLSDNVIDCTNTEHVASGIDLNQCDEVIVSGNMMSGGANSSHAIIVREDITSGKISGNYAFGFSQGVNVDSDCDNLSITDNTFHTMDGHIIVLGTNNTNVTISSNMLYDSGDGTTGYAGISATTPQRAVITGNQIYDTRAGGSRTMEDGIDVGAGDRCVIQGNIVYNIVGTALTESVTNGSVTGNVTS